ncbi:acyl-CoA dehydrogenase family protein [Caulobacter mirabilis]|uniref:Hydrolase n=1 Tax=Caulobacter mirabilis TaxID=69666 RepID=A0A2D2AV86_9CAUL|nr:acyl-CoA dehydrogenase family protein [Caulobacter mirabilis]ATQ41877.1 hydrolase [Caulobacter mirabilis]
MTTFNPLDAVQSLIEEVARRGNEIEAARRLPPDLAGKMASAGLFRMLLPKTMAGHETPPTELALAIETMAQGDASTGWCLMIGATTAFMAARMELDAAREVFGAPKTIAAGVFAPMGKATDDGDHWKVSGRWQWGSGAQNADWIAGGAVLTGPDGKPQLDADGQPRHRMMIFKASEVELIDTWRTSGLCGTGSLDFAVKEVRVPKARSVALHEDAPTLKGPLYKFPAFGMLALGVAAVALGNARGALMIAGGMAQQKKQQGSQRTLAERNTTQTDFARQVAALSAARAHYFECIGVLWAALEAGQDPTLEQRNRLRLACAHAAHVSADVARFAYDMMGGGAVFLENPLQRRFRDAHVITHHAMVAPSIFELTGRILLGQPTRDALL